MSYKRIANGKDTTLKNGNVPYIYIGTEAGKPTPGVGDIAICTDSGITYTCHVNGQWQATEGPNKQRYSNWGGVEDSVMQGTKSGTASSITIASGLIALSTGDSEVTYAYYHSTGLILYPGTDELIKLNFVIDNITNGADNTRRTFVGAIRTAGAATPQGHMFYQLNDNTWECYSYDGAVAAAETAITALSNGDNLGIVIRGDKSASFYVNGVLVATHTTSITANQLYAHAVVYADAVTVSAARAISIRSTDIEILRGGSYD